MAHVIADEDDEELQRAIAMSLEESENPQAAHVLYDKAVIPAPLAFSAC
jgi:hypothetical protein